ncbi:MAG: Asp-tRNA(Asn)/Glu-tRNA(Gln) amidotransferase subunit GatC [Chlamydiales bacterium]|nr:Asp-tRNA(Asn)/Glu-tRNA(Gln) amidotransferase subunit GatC [Chlamydiales bacterium]
MTEFDEKDLLKLTKLCRIECSEAEQKKLLHSLRNILSYIDQLKAVDTEDVAPCRSVLETQVNVTREDRVEGLLSRELFLSNAPAHTGGMVRVPPVMKP